MNRRDELSQKLSPPTLFAAIVDCVWIVASNGHGGRKKIVHGYP